MTRPTLSEVTRRLVAPGSPFEMAEETIWGRRVRVWKHAPRTIRQVVETAAAYGERTYLVYEGERLTYDQSFRRVAGLARHLVQERGIDKGDRVAIAMRNYPEWPLSFWAVTAVGAVAVPLNAWWQSDELAFALEDSGARLLFADAERLARLAPVLRRLRIGTIAVRSAEAGDAPSFDGVASDLDAFALPPVDIHPDDDATLFYTSGTTGRPKGAQGSHRNLCTNIVSRGFALARGALRRGEGIPTPPPDQKATLVSVPFFHVTGCHSLLATNTWTGSKLVLMHKWDPERAVELIEEERINAFGGVPSMAWQVLESKGLGKRDLSSVQSVAYGGAPAAPELVRRLARAFPAARPGNGYGLTESSAIACTNAAEDYQERPDSVGLPVPVCDLKVIDERGRPLPPGSVGQLCIYGPNIVKGYYRNPEATDETFRDGWLHTGDIAKIDEEGFVTILDREKDMLIRGGENIYCVEVEDVLFAHPDVMDAAVVGRPHDVLGEEPEAIVQTRRNARVTEAQLRDWVHERLAAFKVPVRVHLRKEPLPRNENGKILKRSLKRELGIG